MHKRIAAAMLAGSLVLLGACQKEPEDKLESARESATEAMQNIGEAAESTAEAAEQLLQEATGNEPTTGERISETVGAAGERLGDAYDSSTEAIGEVVDQTADKAKETWESGKQTLEQATEKKPAEY